MPARAFAWSPCSPTPHWPPGAPLDPRCGDCTACVDACPPGAIKGRAFGQTSR